MCQGTGVVRSCGCMEISGTIACAKPSSKCQRESVQCASHSGQISNQKVRPKDMSYPWDKPAGVTKSSQKPSTSSTNKDKLKRTGSQRERPKDMPFPWDKPAKHTEAASHTSNRKDEPLRRHESHKVRPKNMTYPSHRPTAEYYKSKEQSQSSQKHAERRSSHNRIPVSSLLNPTNGPTALIGQKRHLDLQHDHYSQAHPSRRQSVRHHRLSIENLERYEHRPSLSTCPRTSTQYAVPGIAMGTPEDHFPVADDNYQPHRDYQGLDTPLRRQWRDERRGRRNNRQRERREERKRELLMEPATPITPPGPSWDTKERRTQRLRKEFVDLTVGD